MTPEEIKEIIGEDAYENVETIKHNLREYARCKAPLVAKSDRGEEVHPIEIMSLINLEDDIGKAMGGWMRITAGLLRVIDRLTGTPEMEVEFGERDDVEVEV